MFYIHNSFLINVPLCNVFLSIYHVQYFYIFLVTCIFFNVYVEICMTICNKDIENTHDNALMQGSLLSLLYHFYPT